MRACRANIPKDEDLTKLYRSIHPDPTSTVLVPVLQHETKDGMVNVIESIPCAEYVEDAFAEHGPALRPASAKQRMAIRMFMEFGAKWMPFGVAMANKEKIQASLDDFVKASVNLNKALEKWGEPGGDFLLGNMFSMAEVFMAPLVIRTLWFDDLKGINAVKILEELKLDRLARWVKACIARPSVKETYKEMEPGTFLEYVKFRGGDKFKVSYEVKDGAVVVTHIDYKPVGNATQVEKTGLPKAFLVVAAIVAIEFLRKRT